MQSTFISFGRCGPSGNVWGNEMSNHLSEDQFVACLLGRAIKPEMDHISNCPECHVELDRLRNILGSFRSAVRDRVENRVASQVPMPLSRPPSATIVVPKWAWSLLAAAALVVTMVPSLMKKPQPVFETDPDALMRAVNIHLSRTMPAAMEPVLALLPEDST